MKGTPIRTIDNKSYSITVKSRKYLKTIGDDIRILQIFWPPEGEKCKLPLKIKSEKKKELWHQNQLHWKRKGNQEQNAGWRAYLGELLIWNLKFLLYANFHISQGLTFMSDQEKRFSKILYLLLNKQHIIKGSYTKALGSHNNQIAGSNFGKLEMTINFTPFGFVLSLCWSGIHESNDPEDQGFSLLQGSDIHIRSNRTLATSLALIITVQFHTLLVKSNPHTSKSPKTVNKGYCMSDIKPYGLTKRKKKTIIKVIIMVETLASSTRSVQYWSFIFSILSLCGKICGKESQWQLKA